MVHASEQCPVGLGDKFLLFCVWFRFKSMVSRIKAIKVRSSSFLIVRRSIKLISKVIILLNDGFYMPGSWIVASFSIRGAKLKLIISDNQIGTIPIKVIPTTSVIVESRSYQLASGRWSK